MVLLQVIDALHLAVAQVPCPSLPLSHSPSLPLSLPRSVCMEMCVCLVCMHRREETHSAPAPACTALPWSMCECCANSMLEFARLSARRAQVRYSTTRVTWDALGAYKSTMREFARLQSLQGLLLVLDVMRHFGVCVCVSVCLCPCLRLCLCPWLCLWRVPDAMHHFGACFRVCRV